MKSLKTHIVLFSALIYKKKYLLGIMRFLRFKRCAQGRVIPNNTSGSERSKLAFAYGRIPTLELIPKRRRLSAANKQLTYVLNLRGAERAGRTNKYVN